MSNKEHMDIIIQGVQIWNKWREEYPDIDPDLSRDDSAAGPLFLRNLSGANLSRTNLCHVSLPLQPLSDVNFMDADLRWVSFSGAHLDHVNFQGANLSYAQFIETTLENVVLGGANLSHANLSNAYLEKTNFERVNLSHADLTEASLYGAKFAHVDLSYADLRRVQVSSTNINDIDHAKLSASDWEYEGLYVEEANFSHANLRHANLSKVNLSHVDLHHAILQDANLRETNLQGANLSGTDLRRANLTNAVLVETNLRSATISECLVYGTSVWRIQLDHAKQQNLVVTSSDEPQVTVDNLKIAQFIYLLLNNGEIRDVIETITTKAVLILGRFTGERKPVLDALREELRKHNLLPIVFDFKSSPKRDLTETISTLAHMSRFIIADLTDAKSIPQELQAIVPHLPSVPVQPILHAGDREYSMFEHFKRYPWVLETYHYQDIPTMLASIKENIIDLVEKKAIELEGQR